MTRSIDCRAWVLRALARTVPRERRGSIAEEADLRALGIDSLGLMVLLGDFCQACRVDVASIDPSEIRVRTVRDLISAAETITGTNAA